MTLPPLAAIGTVRLELFGPGPAHARWGSAIWGEDVWGQSDWQNVTPQSLNAKVSWGADDGARGVVSVAAAGTWNVRTYDPDRKLDPSNTISQFASVLHPGGKVRVRYVGGVTRTVKRGVIDEITYDLDTETGSIRATDGVSVLQGADIPAGTLGAPTTLRARARWLLTLAAIPDITVEPDPPEGDPIVGPAPTEVATVWDWLGTAALDVLYAYWLDSDNVIKFRSFGNPNDLGLSVGGDDGLPIDNVTPQTSLVGLVSKVIAYDVTAPTVAITRINQATQDIVGKAYFERTRPVPNAASWADNALLDLSGAALQYALGTIRPRTEAEFLSLLDTGMVDVCHIGITKRNRGRETLLTPIEAAPRVLGGTFQADTLTGWTAGLVTYVTAAEWSDSVIIPPPIIPPDPSPPPTTTVVRSYLVIRDSRAFQSSSGQNLGSGVEGEMPVGAWAGARNRAFIRFPTIDWSGCLQVMAAELRLTTSTQVNIGFGSSPKIRVQRVTQDWTEGTAGSPSAGNALVYPGPTRTSTGERVANISGSQGVLVAFSILDIAKAWAPASAGGSQAKNYGIALVSYGESSTQYTTEFWAREHAAGTRAELRITMKIPA